MKIAFNCVSSVTQLGGHLNDDHNPHRQHGALFCLKMKLTICVKSLEHVALQPSYRGEGFIEIPGFFAMSVTDARTLICELENEETVNWQRDGF